MVKKKRRKPKPASAPARIFKARAAENLSGLVLRGDEVDQATAIRERKTNRDIVICGDDVDVNRDLAKKIEASVGRYKRHDPHRRAGPFALPHYQQENPPPRGHTFYETANKLRKAR
jgi:hypothetical protein